MSLIIQVDEIKVEAPYYANFMGSECSVVSWNTMVIICMWPNEALVHNGGLRTVSTEGIAISTSTVYFAYPPLQGNK